MEAARVIWVESSGSGGTESRSAVLRAVSRLAIVCRGEYGVRLTPGSVTLDTQFARCEGYRSGSDWQCNDCGVDVCGHCGVVCHAHCKDVVMRRGVRCECKSKVCKL